MNSASRMHDVSPESHAIVDHVLEYTRRRALWEDIPLDTPASPEELARIAPMSITPQGIGAEQALALFGDVLAPTCLSTDHPGYLAFIPSAPSKAATAFDLVVSASSIYGGSWLEGAGAVHAENEVLTWLASEFGLPGTSCGVFVQGGTIGNLSALVTARDEARRRLTEQGRPHPPRWAVVASIESHSSIASAASVMDIDVIDVHPDGDGRLRGHAVEDALATHGDAVLAVVATAGTTNFGIIDDLEGIADVTRRHGVWLHIDGAYGLAGALVPQMRPAYTGIEHADSLIVDPHKWLFAPFDACALIYREPMAALRAHTQHAAYLDTLAGSAAPNPSDLAVQLTRRARGLPLWFSLATYGTDEYRAAIAHGIDLAHRLATEVERRPGLSLVRRPQLSVVVLRRDGWAQHDYEAWCDHLLASQKAFVVPSSHEGEPVLRLAIINPLTTFELLCEVLDTLG
ncbi:pyridoxal phosphate-dependent decarboxylase family protein [Demequina gelatinilytica]|uniref:pyridoxal phosphate-dependent decarboxylase family protein n=1 Tax=Demequina gelatinilytica TaxID=1638980 RepID=UPI0007844BA1|nr:aminotransferase class V-fold PLP-dependent enzyme [Demequina gelatinilytica]